MMELRFHAGFGSSELSLLTLRKFSRHRDKLQEVYNLHMKNMAAVNGVKLK